MLPGAAMSRTLSSGDYDWVVIDCEHGNISDDGMHICVNSVRPPCTPIVRVMAGEHHLIKRALDTGVHGIIVPLVNTVEQAQNVAKFSRFPPVGNRGFGSPFSMAPWDTGKLSQSDYLVAANDTIIVGVQIETQEAVDNVDAIAAVDGIDMCGLDMRLAND